MTIEPSENKAVFILFGGETSIRLEMPLPMSRSKWDQIKKMIDAVESDFVTDAQTQIKTEP